MEILSLFELNICMIQFSEGKPQKNKSPFFTGPATKREGGGDKATKIKNFFFKL